MKETSIFTKIINGSIPADFIYSDDQCVAILDISPLGPMHTLIIPRLECDHFMDLPENIACHLTVVSQKVSKALKTVCQTDRVIMLTEGFLVPHVHIHLIPSDRPIELLKHQKEKYQEYKETFYEKAKSLLRI